MDRTRHIVRLLYLCSVRQGWTESCALAENWKHRHGSVNVCKWTMCIALTLGKAEQATDFPTSGVHRSCCAGYWPSNKWCPPKMLRRVQDFQQLVSTEALTFMWSPESQVYVFDAASIFTSLWSCNKYVRDSASLSDGPFISLQVYKEIQREAGHNNTLTVWRLVCDITVTG